MMFKKISYRIAWQFTGFVFLLLLVNGAVFHAADFLNARRQASFRMARSAQVVMQGMHIGPGEFAIALPPPLRERVRILNETGVVLHSGVFFSDVPFAPGKGITRVILGDEPYAIFTAPIEERGHVMGYMQIAEPNRFSIADLRTRMFMYLLVSLGISGLTFMVGLFFARRSLRPAEAMMARLEQFTQDASHELRTPLSTLNSSLDLALRNKKYREGLESAKEDVQEISILVERLLDLARLDQFHLHEEDIDLSTLAATTLEKYRPQADSSRVILENDIQPHIHVTGDAALVRQLLGNLLSNAIKFSKVEGTVRLSIHPEGITVSDDGIGIAQEALPHIFDRFYQAESSRSKDGFGLGLSLVKRIVDLHEWTIEIESTEGKGTTVSVRFSSHRP